VNNVNNSEDSDGCAIFYHTDVFQITQLRCGNICLNGEHNSQVYILMQLKHKRTKKRVNVLCVHLKAFEEHSKLRAEQTSYLINMLKEALVDKKHVETRLAQQPILICGDFNGDPSEEFYKLFFPDRDSRNANNSQKPAATFELSDAYKAHRKFNTNLSRTVDYILYTHSTLNLLNYATMERGGMMIPSLAYPSDHLALVCDFQFN
jgi:nocturnin